MRMLAMNLLLAWAWAIITGTITSGNIAVGFVVGYGVLWLTHRVTGARDPYFRKFFKLAKYSAMFLWELLLANLRVAYDVITPRHHMRPGVVAIPLHVKTDVQITVLANLITLTPGTLSLDVSDDRKTLYLHVMYLTSPEQLRREIKEGIEHRVLELTES